MLKTLTSIFSPFSRSPGQSKVSTSKMDSENHVELNGGTTVEPVVPKKKRGRPPKNANAAKSAESAVAENGTSPVTTAVTPSKPLVTSPVNNASDNKSPAKENGNSVSPAVPKKRGRPPKSATVVKPADSVTENGASAEESAAISSAQFYSNTIANKENAESNDENVTDIAEPDSEPESHSPKKRGRPPKNANAAQKDKNEPAKKRGRPKKAENQAVTATTDDAAEPAGDTVAPVKRGRGRPKKIKT